jgi:hypothetical protein
MWASVAASEGTAALASEVAHARSRGVGERGERFEHTPYSELVPGRPRPAQRTARPRLRTKAVAAGNPMPPPVHSRAADPVHSVHSETPETDLVHSKPVHSPVEEEHLKVDKTEVDKVDNDREEVDRLRREEARREYEREYKRARRAAAREKPGD